MHKKKNNESIELIFLVHRIFGTVDRYNNHTGTFPHRMHTSTEE